MESLLRRTVGAAALLCLTPVIAVSQAMAGTNVFDPSLGFCEELNCSSEQISGTTGELTGTVSGVNLLPWTVQIFAPGAGFCLRVEVVSQTQDLVMNLVEPDGSAFFDDDSAGGLRPLIKVNPTSDRGWNTLQVSRFAGEFPDDGGSNFTLLYGLYPGNNRNCANPTQERLLVAEKDSGGKSEVDVAAMGADKFDSENMP
jgi:hypothetical protein